MSLPPHDVLNVINELILEITGFQESDENFAICQRYCLSHVVHHTYPFVNRTSVQNLLNSYVSRFYGHGYFKVSQELENQVKSFLSNVSLFEKNPQYDIQWSLLSLLSSLSANLTAVKHVPEMLPINIEDVECENINWHDYLKIDLPKLQYSDESDTTSTEGDSNNENENVKDDVKEESEQNESDETVPNMRKKKSETILGSQKKSQKEKSDNNLSDQIVKFENGRETLQRKNQIQNIIKDRLSATDIANDFKKWGNISEKFDALLYREGFSKRSQFLSELEMMEYILYQFQTGERILLKKGLTHPALLSVTQKTLANYIESLQPYFQIIRCLKDFERDIKMAKYPELYQNSNSNESLTGEKFCFLSSPIKKKNISNVLYVYSLLLGKALDPFQNRIIHIFDNLDSYSIIRMQRDIQAHFFELTSLFYVHGLATKNWKKESNWICSIRVLSVLYNAIMEATTTKMSFLYLNMFLQCFQIYLDIIDSWISFLTLNDPNEDFIVAAPNPISQLNSFCAPLEIRPFKDALKNAGVKEVPILDFICQKMCQVGESLEVLRRMGRFVSEETIPKTSSYRSLVDLVSLKIDAMKLDRVKSSRPERKVQEKKRSIFTIRNVNFGLTRDDGMGDCSAIGLLLEEFKGEMKDKKEEEENNSKGCEDHCRDSVYSSVKNPFFRKAFQNVGVNHQMERLKKKVQRGENGGDLAIDMIKWPSDEKFGVYTYHKVILESCRDVISSRISFACDLVKKIVIEESNLKGHVSLLRSLLLFNDSYLIQPFLQELFTQPAVWDNSYSLTFHIRECLENRYPDLVSSLSVFSQTSLTAPKDILEAIDALTVSYEVKWPLTLILTPDIMIMYNNILRLALKLKWAHWMLTSLHFRNPGNDSGSFKSNRHRLQVLRFWFLSSLGLLKNYFMAQMSPPGPDFDSCANLKEIIEAHSNFINGIHRNCFLGGETPEMRSLIFQNLIPLCVDLEKFWTEGKVVANAKLNAMEKTFAKCQLRLSRVLP